MQINYGYEHIGQELQNAFVTIGNFDGIHLGHRQLLTNLVREAHCDGRKAVVITFEPHPKMLIHPERRPFYLITSLEEKLNLLAECGLDAVIVVGFNLKYAQTSAHDFFTDFLCEKLRISRIVIGHDYTFGRGKEGNEALLIFYGKKLGFEVEVINAFATAGTIISSTRIRQAILEGDMETAQALLGRPYNVAGVVVAGQRRGAALGFPTANIAPEKEMIPPDGVYAVKARLAENSIGGVMNIGTNPTFADSRRSLEVHLFDFNKDIYGQRLDVSFLKRLRGEITFPNVEQLVSQIRRDVSVAKKILTAS